MPPNANANLRSLLEPTIVPPVLLDLCGLTILHRFSSPSWWEHLIKHVSADFTGTDVFDQVVKLQVRLLAVFPTGICRLIRCNTRRDKQLSLLLPR
jgi:hypothetical protein